MRIFPPLIYKGINLIRMHATKWFRMAHTAAAFEIFRSPNFDAFNNKVLSARNFLGRDSCRVSGGREPR